MRRLKVSVIMPVYNAEAALEESIRSYIDQSLKETELICVNDGSSGTSPIILADFQEQQAQCSA